MEQQSDTVQRTATAYAEREVLEACCRALPQVGRVLALSLAGIGSQTLSSSKLAVESSLSQLPAARCQLPRVVGLGFLLVVRCWCPWKAGLGLRQAEGRRSGGARCCAWLPMGAGRQLALAGPQLSGKAPPTRFLASPQ